MDLGEVTVAEKPAYDKLFLEVEQDHEFLHTVYPVVALHARVNIEVYRMAPRHNNEPVQVLLSRIFEVMLLQPAVLDIQNASLLSVSLALYI